MTRAEWKKTKRSRKQIIGLNPEWIIRYIITPLGVLGLILLTAITINVKYTTYATEKQKAEEEARIIQESIEAEELVLQLERHKNTQRRLEEERRANEIKQAELEKQRTNTLYENQVSKKVCPIGTYLRNDKTKKVGRVVGYYGLEVITNNDWNVVIDSNGTKPDEITEIGYAEYIRTLQRQKEKEEKKQNRENAKKIQQILDEEIKQLTSKTKAYLGDYKHIEYQGKKYRIVDIKGEELTLLEQRKRNKKTNYVYLNAYEEGIRKIHWREFEIIQNGS